MSGWVLTAFVVGLLVLGWSVGILTYHVNLAWFLATVWKPEGTKREAEHAIALLKRRMERESLRDRLKKRTRVHATGRHLQGVPPTRSAVDEVHQEMKAVRPPLESRRL